MVWHLHLILPAELTGSLVAISLENSVEHPTDFKGEFANMHCELKSCNVAYSGFKIDEDQVEEAIFYSTNSLEEFTGKLAVARSFAKDPGGVILGDPAIYCVKK